MNEALQVDKEYGEERQGELATANLAGTKPLDEAWRESRERENGGATNSSGDEETAAALLPAEDGDRMRAEWNSIQASFVDEPRAAVEKADNLVAATMKRLTENFAEERSKLESQWDRGDDVSTEDLRIALRRYRSFFQRLLSV
ncbi:MAG TPA: hypothetical protein VNX86_08935 [Rhizomicrobium sp.]|jgi:hypothetical protein|nr:hypothetical protein [Rhizomicrobium sp.]